MTLPPKPMPTSARRSVYTVDRPERTSLSDGELLSEFADTRRSLSRTLDSIDRLEAELDRRRRDALEFVEWQQRMLAEGTPESLDRLEVVRTDFIDVIRPEQIAAARAMARPVAEAVGMPVVAPVVAPAAAPDVDVASAAPTPTPAEPVAPVVPVVPVEQVVPVEPTTPRRGWFRRLLARTEPAEPAR